MYNKLLETLKDEFRTNGYVNCTRGRISAWYTEQRKQLPFLRRTTSYITREKLFALGQHFAQYVETERLKAIGVKPEAEFGEPHFRRYSDRFSIPLTITHDGTVGSARFINMRTIRITKLGDIHLSREFPFPNFRPKKATLYQTADGKWRIGITFEGKREKRTFDTPKPVGIDCNIGNVATPDMVIEPPDTVMYAMANLKRTIKHSQRVMNRREGPDHKNRIPPSKRYERARKRHAKLERRFANIGKNMRYKIANKICNSGATHVICEDNLRNLVKSARGTVDNPGRNVRQKAALNRKILAQGWGHLIFILSYMVVGSVIRINPAYTSQTCSWCGFTDAINRWKRLFHCVSCGFTHHADCNASCNICNKGCHKLGLPPEHIDSLDSNKESAHGKGCLDVEGSTVPVLCGGKRPLNRQTWIGVEGAVRVVHPWNDM